MFARLNQWLERRRWDDELARLDAEQLADVGIDPQVVPVIERPDSLVLQCVGLEERLAHDAHHGARR